MSGQMLDALVQALAFPVAGGILLNQLDDLFIDANYYLRGLHRREARVVSKDDLLHVRQKRIAIIVPAWREAEVIERMLLHNLKTLDYDPDRYVIFCGTYQNDPETQACVDRVAKRFRSVRKVVVPHDGPTSKADCLNWVYQGIVLEEQRRGHHFEILLMHDAEDVIHPLSLRLYSLLIPEHEFVQTPVFSLGLSARKLVAGTYIDEFAEHHLKDMRVREAIGGLIPSAGVGSAFSRQAFEELAREQGQLPFNTESLTEDYEIGLKFRLANRRVTFACKTLLASDGSEEYIATREYFPDGFAASIRQRSRWICGITLQTWKQIGWKGALPVLYCLWRDRKAPFTNVLLLFAYALLLYVLARSAIAAAIGSSFSMASIIPAGSILSVLFSCNLAMMIWRGLVKLSLVRRLYGWRQGLMSFPRLFVSNVINVAATGRALWQYTNHLWTGEPLRWLKTSHAFPSAQVLEAQHPRLGELLRDFHGLSEEKLHQALEVQAKTGLRLGRVLVSSGMATNRAIATALADQWGLEVAELDPQSPPLELLRALPEVEAEGLRVLPLAAQDARVAVAAAEPLSDETLSALERRFDADIVVRIAPESWIARARLRAYRRLYDVQPRRERLGEWLLARGFVSPEALTDLLDEHWETGRLLGELALRRGLVTIDDLRVAMPNLGAPLVRLSRRDIDNAKIDRLGIGFCALYSLVPLRDGACGVENGIASVFPLHPNVVQIVEGRLDAAMTPLLSIRKDVLSAIGHRLAASPFPRLAVGLHAFDVDALLRQSGIETRAHSEPSRISSLEDGENSKASLARLDLLPARLASEADIRIEELEGQSLVLSCPRPMPRISQELNWLLPNWKIAWRARSNHDNGGRRNAIEGGRLIEAESVA